MSAELRPAWAEIDPGALSANYQALSALAAPARITAVVKADAYGHGAVTVAGVLFDAGCRDFAVAMVEEGVELRRSGIDGEILVLSEAPPDALSLAAENDISVTIYSAEGAKFASAARAAHGGGSILKMHLKVDTGMYRVGASADRLDEVADAALAGDLEGVWSHFAVADGTSDDDIEFTRLQIDRFREALHRLSARGIVPTQTHISNTAGLLYYPEARFSIVRVGIGLYGYLPGESARPIALVPVMSLVSKVVFIKEVEANERPSYGRQRALAKNSLVATIPVGYADGVPRALFAGGGEVLINGRRYPLAGMITMDQILVDLGDDSEVSIGDEAVLIGASGGERIDADEWAKRCATISWEILCGISKRIPRRTLGETSGS